jgi:hypothetical protein
VDLDVEVKTHPTLDRFAQQALFTPPLQHRLQALQQVAVLAAQVDQPAPRPHDPGADGHALDHAIGITRQQHPVLERARLALVGVADHIACLPRGVAAQLPLGRRGIAGAAAPAQFGALEIVEHALWPTGNGRSQRLSGCGLGAQLDIGQADLVVHTRPFGRPLRWRNLSLDQRRNMFDAPQGSIGSRCGGG